MFITSLDQALGIGDCPRGRLIEISGFESSGKTTLGLQAIAEVQRSGGLAAFIDADHTFDHTYARQLGVDCQALLLSRPATGEQGLRITYRLVRSGIVDLVVIDPVAALAPQAEMDNQVGSRRRNLHSKLVSRALAALSTTLKRSNTTLMFINQQRRTSNDVTRAFERYASIRLDMRRIGSLMKNDEVIGDHVHISVIKNTLTPLLRETCLDILYGTGISPISGDLQTLLPWTSMSHSIDSVHS